MQLDAAPLEAALLQHVARGRIGDARARIEMIVLELLEEEVDRAARGLGGKALAPMLDAEPVAELGIVGRGAVDADHADRPGVVLDQEHGLAAERGGGADEFDGVVLRIGVWKATGVFRRHGGRWRGGRWS